MIALIKEQGRVEKIEKDKATVRIEKSSECASCKSRGSCEVSKRDMLIEVLNDMKAGEGDYVEISVPEGTLLKLSALVYLFPVIALIGGAFAGALLAGPFGMNESIAAVLGGGILIGLAFYCLKRLDRARSAANNVRSPRMTRIVASAGSPPQPSDSI